MSLRFHLPAFCSNPRLPPWRQTTRTRAYLSRRPMSTRMSRGQQTGPIIMPSRPRFRAKPKLRPPRPVVSQGAANLSTRMRPPTTPLSIARSVTESEFLLSDPLSHVRLQRGIPHCALTTAQEPPTNHHRCGDVTRVLVYLSSASHPTQGPRFCAITHVIHSSLLFRDCDPERTDLIPSFATFREAVTTGQVKACIMCLKMPRGIADHFCSKVCREAALSP